MYIVLANLMCLCVRGCGYVFVGVHVHAYESDLMIVISMHGRLEFWGMHFKTVCVGREEEGGGGYVLTLPTTHSPCEHAYRRVYTHILMHTHMHTHSHSRTRKHTHVQMQPIPCSRATV
jgi:hypothetical protein